MSERQLTWREEGIQPALYWYCAFSGKLLSFIELVLSMHGISLKWILQETDFLMSRGTYSECAPLSECWLSIVPRPSFSPAQCILLWSCSLNSVENDYSQIIRTLLSSLPQYLPVIACLSRLRLKLSPYLPSPHRSFDIQLCSSRPIFWTPK